MSATHTNLSSVLWPAGQTRQNAAVRHLALVVAGVVLLTISAKAKIPFWPVPFTLQTLVLLLLGMSYGRGLATATAIAYLALGATGAPVFATGGGVAYMVGPTGGYLLGFVLAMALMGHLGDRGWGRTVKSMLVPMLLGTAVIFACGVGWLTFLIGPEKALAAGLYPFVFSEALKVAVAMVLMPTAWRYVEKGKGS